MHDNFYYLLLIYDYFLYLIEDDEDFDGRDENLQPNLRK